MAERVLSVSAGDAYGDAGNTFEIGRSNKNGVLGIHVSGINGHDITIGMRPKSSSDNADFVDVEGLNFTADYAGPLVVPDVDCTYSWKCTGGTGAAQVVITENK